MGISENADSPLLCSREIKLMQYSKDDIQKEILKAAEKVFLENGFPKASMREIAQEAQVGLSNIYNYFKSKDDIFCTVVVIEQISWKCIPPRVCAKTLDAILNYWFFVYLWKETKQYIYKLHSRRKQKIKFK